MAKQDYSDFFTAKSTAVKPASFDQKKAADTYCDYLIKFYGDDIIRNVKRENGFWLVELNKEIPTEVNSNAISLASKKSVDKVSVGSRIHAFSSYNDDTIHYLGTGTFVREAIVTNLLGKQIESPEFMLDNKTVVYGTECYWVVDGDPRWAEFIKNRKLVNTDITAEFSRFKFSHLIQAEQT